jgi:uncharacterized protein (DUF305 family)
MDPHFAGLDRRSVLGTLLLAAVPAAAQERGRPADVAETFDNEVFGAQSREALSEINEALRRLAEVISRPPSGDLDGDLADKIIAFHQTSIDVAQVILSSATDPQLRTLASANINQEAASIASIRTWIENRVDNPAEPGMHENQDQPGPR